MDVLFRPLLSCLVMVAHWCDVSGHGRLVEPPSRSSAWRFGFHTPINYNDNQLFCGGFWNQWGMYGGKCGMCGDPYQGPRDNEAGGRYATGTIVREYTSGDVIDVTVELTANHLGWFEFRLCPNNNPKKAISQACLDKYLLRTVDGSTRYKVAPSDMTVDFRMQLPATLTCSQCVLQWKYNTGNRWGIDPSTGKGCLGCGPQEQFYGCADVTINKSGRPRKYHNARILKYIPNYTN